MRGRRDRRACWLPSNYIAIIAEKPKAGDKISLALGRRVKCYLNKIPFWIVNYDGQPILVVSSAGHLYGPYTEIKGYPVLNYEWKPLWQVESKERHLKKFYEVLKRLLPKARYYVNACDYDIEGSVIGYMIILHLGDVNRAFRMKFSSLAPSEIRNAFRRLQPLDWDMIEAGVARHELDWLWGINVSRALMDAYYSFTGKRLILSAGRVQSPTLVEAVRRWRERNLFVPKPSFKIIVTLNKDDFIFKARPLNWSPRTRDDALKIARELKTLGLLYVKEVYRSIKEVRPPPAFNLGDLQREASRIYGFSPMKTQEIAEDLYLNALISYPRTNSQKLPPAINYKNIMMNLKKIREYSTLINDLLLETKGVLAPVQGKKEDPAHPAIYPTGELPKGDLSRDEKRIYDLIVRRFLAAFANSAKIATVKVILVDAKGRPYVTEGVNIIKEGWLKYYIFLKPREQTLPRLLKGEEIPIIKVNIETSWTTSSIELTKMGLLKWMERVNIGTEGTRARIIEQLFKRGYLLSKGNKFYVSELGLAVSSIIENLFPSLATPELTRDFEEKLEDIRRGKRRRIEVISEAKRVIIMLLNEFKRRKMEIGRILAESVGLIEPEVKCVICGKRAENLRPVPLCNNHYEAFLRLKKEVQEISKRLSVNLEEALKIIISRRETGAWIRDVAELALKNPKVLSELTS
jgi:DNA topoisomerase-1